MNGVIIVNKPKDITSHDVIYKLRKKLKTKKIGHCGTLDPLATGVLVCLVNQATKLSNYLVLDTKEYIAEFKLGLSTTTQDLEGDIVEEKTYLNDIDEELLKNVLLQFKGLINQTPSIYSAIKVNGKKLYEYARNNEPVVIPQREVTIFELELLSFKDDLIKIRVLCSSGTYIRTLCFDIAKKLGYPGVLTSLHRTKSGHFDINQAYNLEDIDYTSSLISIEDGLRNFKQINFSTDIVKDVYNGIKLSYDSSDIFVVLDNNKAIALYGPSDKDGFCKMLRGLW